jgi:hypothetical protein
MQNARERSHFQEREGRGLYLDGSPSGPFFSFIVYLFQRISQSFRCADLDKEVPELMGVSKAILENVVSLNSLSRPIFQILYWLNSLYMT